MANLPQTLQPWWYEKIVSENTLIRRPITNPWDLVYLNGFLLPGISEVQISKSRKLDVKESAGRPFATITDKGYKPIDLIIKTVIWTPEQFAGWQGNILPMIETIPSQYKTANKINAFKIVHPAAACRGLTDITIETIKGPTKSGIQGVREFEIKAIQWAPEFKASVTNTPKGSGINPHSNAATSDRKRPSGTGVPSKPTAPTGPR